MSENCAHCEECGNYRWIPDMLRTPEGEYYCEDCRSAYEAEVVEDIIEDIFGIDL